MPYKTPPPSPQPKTWWDAQGKIHSYSPTTTPIKYGSFMNTPGYNMGHADSALRGLNIVLPCTPDLPSGYIGDPKGKSLTTLDGGGGGGEGDSVKVVNPSNFLEVYVQNQPDYAAESKVAFNNLTTIEILDIARNYDVRTDSSVLNPNILDIVDVVNSFSPTEIIKLQDTSDRYFSLFEENLAENSSEITTIPGIAEIKVPQKNDNNLSKTQVQILAPKIIQRGTEYPIA